MTTHMDEHGKMEFVGFDSERFVVFQCKQCGEKIAMNPKHDTIKFLERGNIYATHSAMISQHLFSPEVYKMLWDIDVISEIADVGLGLSMSVEVPQ